MSFNSDQPLLVNQLPISIEFPRDEDKFYEILTDIYKRIANCVNTKEGGLYSLNEVFNSQQFFITGNPNSFRNVYRKTFDVVALNGGNIGASATVTFPHNINGIKFATMIYASCTSTSNDFFTVVYPNATMNATTFTFINPIAKPLNAVYFIAEILKT